MADQFSPQEQYARNRQAISAKATTLEGKIAFEAIEELHPDSWTYHVAQDLHCINPSMEIKTAGRRMLADGGIARNMNEALISKCTTFEEALLNGQSIVINPNEKHAREIDINHKDAIAFCAKINTIKNPA